MAEADAITNNQPPMPNSPEVAALIARIEKMFAPTQLANPDMQEICRVACALAAQGKIHG